MTTPWRLRVDAVVRRCNALTSTMRSHNLDRQIRLQELQRQSRETRESLSWRHDEHYRTASEAACIVRERPLHHTRQRLRCALCASRGERGLRIRTAVGAAHIEHGAGRTRSAAADDD